MKKQDRVGIYYDVVDDVVDASAFAWAAIVEEKKAKAKRRARLILDFKKGSAMVVGLIYGLYFEQIFSDWAWYGFVIAGLIMVVLVDLIWWSIDRLAKGVNSSG